jgi:hypothetical protein
MTVSVPPRRAWPEVLASALLGTSRGGEQAEVLLEAAAAHALRRRAGTALVPAAAQPGGAPASDAPTVGPAAAARAGDLLALDSAPGGLVRDVASRLELLSEWLTAAVAAGRTLPAELVPALLDAGRRHRILRPLIAPAAGPLAEWLAGQRTDWSYASGAPRLPSTVDDRQVWELGTTAQRVAYLAGLRRDDPARGRAVLRTAWESQPPDERPQLLAALRTGLTLDDEPLLEHALDDRRRQVRDVALDLLARLPDSGHAHRMAERAARYIRLTADGRIDVVPPEECDRAMRRDGVAPRPAAGMGERAWWLEEIVARAPLGVWGEPETFLARPVSEGWLGTLRRGLARAAAVQRDGAWAAALVDPLTADVAADGRPEDRLLLEALYDALPPEALAARATAALRRGLPGATAVGIDHVLALCPRPWPPAVADAVFAALDDHLGHHGNAWRVAGVCELAALRLPADLAPRAAALVQRLNASAPTTPGLPAVQRFAATLRFRHDMLEELA